MRNATVFFLACACCAATAAFAQKTGNATAELIDLCLETDLPKNVIKVADALQPAERAATYAKIAEYWAREKRDNYCIALFRLYRARKIPELSRIAFRACLVYRRENAVQTMLNFLEEPERKTWLDEARKSGITSVV